MASRWCAASSMVVAWASARQCTLLASVHAAHTAACRTWWTCRTLLCSMQWTMWQPVRYVMHAIHAYTLHVPHCMHISYIHITHVPHCVCHVLAHGIPRHSTAQLAQTDCLDMLEQPCSTAGMLCLNGSDSQHVLCCCMQVQSRSDLESLRSFLDDCGGESIRIIAKIETVAVSG
jgi:hypothetical protein